MLQCSAVCCSVLQCVAVLSIRYVQSVLQCVAVVAVRCTATIKVRVLSQILRYLQSVLQCVAVVAVLRSLQSVLQCVAVVAVRCTATIKVRVLSIRQRQPVLQCVAVCSNILQYAALCCSVLQRVAALRMRYIQSHRRKRSDSKELRLRKSPTNFHGSPHASNTFSRQSPRFQKGIHGSKRKSPSLKTVHGKPSNLEIQVFQV